MTDDQIKHMVDRFLAWRLPENFNPDAGISFKPTFNDHLPTPMRHDPIGTNLLDATQADAMVRHMIEGLPSDFPSGAVEALRIARRQSEGESAVIVLPEALDKVLAWIAAHHRAPVAGREEGLRSIARDLIDQDGEPWTEGLGVSSARVHFWRDKAIRGSQAILALIPPSSDSGREDIETHAKLEALEVRECPICGNKPLTIPCPECGYTGEKLPPSSEGSGG